MSRGASVETDETIHAANRALRLSFRQWMTDTGSPLSIGAYESPRYASDALTFTVSRKHRTSSVLAMLDRINERAPASHGHFYVHDDVIEGKDIRG